MYKDGKNRFGNLTVRVLILQKTRRSERQGIRATPIYCYWRETLVHNYYQPPFIETIRNGDNIHSGLIQPDLPRDDTDDMQYTTLASALRSLPGSATNSCLCPADNLQIRSPFFTSINFTPSLPSSRASSSLSSPMMLSLAVFPDGCGINASLICVTNIRNPSSGRLSDLSVSFHYEITYGSDDTSEASIRSS